MKHTKHNEPPANNESSEVCGIIKPGRRVKLNRSQAKNVHRLLTFANRHSQNRKSIKSQLKPKVNILLARFNVLYWMPR